MSDSAQRRPAARRGAVMVNTMQIPTAANQNPAGETAPGDGPWLLVLDLKSAPDRDILPHPPEGAEPSSPLPKPMYHRIAALAFLRARIVTGEGTERLVVEECRAGGRGDTPEASLLSGFWRTFETLKPKLVTFNGRGFVIPVLKYRSMRHRLSAKYLHEAGDRWSGYGNRYALNRHVDLMDVMSDHHASPFPSLVDVALGLGLPHRPAVDQDTEALLSEGRAEDVRGQAEADVATIFLGYVRWRLLTGNMTLEAHDEAVGSLRAILEGRASERPEMAHLLEGWPT